MAEPTDRPGAEPPVPPEPEVAPRRRWRVSLVWIVPIVAIVAGTVLGVRTWLGTGPTVTISFRTAEGLDAGRTEVRYKEVVVGRVTKVGLSEDRQHVVATVSLDAAAGDMAVEDTRFWVVRPRIGAAGISGLGTLLSGAYIGVDAGVSEKSQRKFTGLEAPPFVLRGEPGKSFVLDAPQLGSLDVGSPVYYRRTRVGRVVGHALDPVKDALTVTVFVEAPYDQLVSTESRFWNASGVDVALDANGLTVNSESIATLLAGGVGFQNPPGAASAPRAADGAHFRLHRDRKTALRPPDGQRMRVRMVFEQSIHGLAVDAPVELLGFEIGTVEQVTLGHDAQRKTFPVEVLADIYPQRLGRLRQALVGNAGDAAFMQRLVENGLRAQLRNGNLLTGQLYVALDFVPQAPKAAVSDGDGRPLTLPTAPGGLQDVQQEIAEIVKRLGKVKFDEIGTDLQALLKSARGSSDTLQKTLANANAMIDRLTPEAQAALAQVRRTLQSAQATLDNLDRNVARGDAPLQRNAAQTLTELQRAARALRVLSDYLQQHPESLLRGKPPDPDPGRSAEPAR